MKKSIEEIEDALASLGKNSPWSGKLKVSDEFLNPVFAKFFEKLKLPNLMQKTDLHTLVQYLPETQIPLESPTRTRCHCRNGPNLSKTFQAQP